MTAYLFGKITVTDPSWLPEYTERVIKLLADVGAKYHVKSTKTIMVEGDGPPPNATIIIEFPSLEIAKDWYHSPEYGELIKLRSAGAKCELFIAEGV